VELADLLASYGILAAFVLLLIVTGIMTSDTLLSAVNYHVTELVPPPSLRPERLPKPKPLPVRAKLLPPEPVFEKPKLIVPTRSAHPNCSRRKLSRPRWQ